LLWRIPAKVTTSVETLSVEIFLEGSPYSPEALHQVMKLQAENNWERLTRAGYTLMQAVPLDRVGEEFKTYKLPLSGVPERATSSDEGSDA
jgi:coenzyme F420-reducing hydrogenase gamma subunit